MSADEERNARVLRFKRITEQELPDRARRELWPLRLDHCFKRVCLDWACQACWYAHIARPAERHMSEVQMERALACAEDLLLGDVALLRERNAASLAWRGKSSARST